jgi:carboxylesterase type B
VTHTEEMSSVWGYATGVEGKLIPTVQSYWTSFIRTKDPNTYKLSSAPAWAPFGTAMARLHFPNDPKNVGMEVVDPAQKDRCHYYKVISNMIGQ